MSMRLAVPKGTQHRTKGEFVYRTLRDAIVKCELRPGERLVKWARRRPTVALLAAMTICLAALAIGGGFWLERQRSDKREARAREEGRASQAVEAALEKVATLTEQGSWPAARQVLIGAESHLAEANNPNLQQRVRKARKAADLATTLEEIRMRVAWWRCRPTSPWP